MNFHSTTNIYTDDRYSLILQVEEGGNPHLTPYNDGKGWVTIGVGFNLADATVRTMVFAKLGITNPQLINDLTIYLQDPHRDVSDSDIQSKLDSYMAQYTPGSTFQFANETQAKELFNGPDGNNGLVQTYENRVDKWASDKGLAVIPESKERLVLLSLSYNGVLGPSLAAAIKADNRAEAWYEIRYGSNGDKQPGLAKRHYYESDVFGLYDDTPGSVSDAEAESILQMYTRHRADILNYEATYSAQIDAANNDYQLSGVSLVDTLDQMLDAARNRIISAEVTGRGITRIIDGDVLVGQDVDYITSKRTWYKNDILTGTDKNDLILGGEGDDRLEGGKGDDILIGGAGVDVYVIQGHDIIIDNGQNSIIYNGEAIAGVFKSDGSGSTFTATDGRVLSFHSPGQLILSAEDSITFQNQTSNADFAGNDFGIHLLDSPAPVRIYNGDQRAPLIGSEIDLTVPPTNASFNTYKWSATSWAADGTLTGGVAQANFNDVIVGSSGIDSINGLGGNDALDGGAGNDTLDGGTGDDLIGGGAGSDIIYGGAGNDEILSATGLSAPQRTGPGDDWQAPVGATAWIEGSTWGVAGDANGYTIYGGGSLTQDNASDIIFAGDGDDSVTGGLGDDYIDGGLNDDTLTGQGGNDIIDGGDGNDFIQGDGIVSPGFYETVAEANHGNDYLDGGAGDDTVIGDGENDVLFGGSGNDFLWGDEITETDLAGQYHGNDYLDGGQGDDQLVGGGKDDTLIGGGGNDVLFGDASINALAAQYHGNDYLDGGDGNDYLDGGAGDDFLLGGDGIDSLHGGNGNDYLEGGDGDDLSSANGNTAGDGGLDGRAGDDTIYGGAGMDELDGGDGFDLLDGGTGDDLLFGGAGDDNLFGGEGNDQLQGGEGNDRLDGGAGNEFLFGEAGNDQLHGDDGDDELQGGDGNDILEGDAGADNLFGQEGNDTLIGGSGADYLAGGSGDDIYLDVTLLDTLFDNDGNDTIVLKGASGLATTQALALAGNSSMRVTLDSGETLNILDVFFGSHFNLQFGNGALIDLESQIGNTFTTAINLQLGNTGGRLFGGAANDILRGGSGNDTLDGHLGNDLLIGGVGNDTYGVDNALDVVTEALNEGTDTVQSSITFTLGANVENLTLTGTTAINGTGNALDNVLTGNSAVNTLTGAAGNDTYVIGASDVVVEILNEGTDTVQSSVTYTLGADIENLTLTGTTIINGTGNALDNVLTGNSAANILIGDVGNDSLTGNEGDDLLDGGAGADSLNGGAGNDTYVVDNTLDVVNEALNEGTDTIQSSITYTLGANVENLTLIGTTATNGTGNTLNNILTGNSAANTLNGGAGVDTLTGGAGNDTYVVDNALDVVTEAFNDGTDTVQSSVTFTLTDDVENLTLTSTAAINGTGNTLNNVLTGNSAANTLNGGAGADTLTGGAGNDIYLVDDTLDVVTEALNAGTDTVQSSITYTLGTNVENLSLTGTTAINGTGNTLNNILTGNSAANTISGGIGADTLIGGAGNDTYVVDNALDIVTEALNAGIDTVQSSITYTLGANVENLTLIGAVAINGTGNTLNNVLTGNSAANTLTGGAGNDIYVIATGDTVVEALNAGTDTVQSSITYTLGANVENLTLIGATAINGTGNALNNVLTGNSAANTLTGGAGNDRLAGGAGADTMQGGAGNDTYVVDVATDVVTENANEGTDTVETGITYTLGANVENLTLTGTTAINGAGNTLNNILTGNSAANTLNGGAGVDTLTGGAGNDTYVVDNTLDIVTEALNAGTDTVQSSITYTLGANVENLTLTGTAAINGTGNTLNNVLTGNSAVNTLTGGAGDDTYVIGTGDIVTEAASAGTDTVQSGITYTLGSNVENFTLTGTAAINGTGNALNNILTGNSAVNTLTGGAGDDTYVIGTGDIVVEATSAGTDTVQSSITYTLGANVENLTLTGTTAINGTGNTLNNVLIGNSAANSLSGGAGNDTLDGLAGADTLTGGTGNDTYKLGLGYGADTAIDTDATVGNTDVLSFLSGVANDQIWFQHVGTNLEVSIIGTNDKMTVSNWYAGSANHIEQFKTADGKQLLDTQVENLVSAMASFSPPAAGQTTLPQNYQDALAPVLAANWQ